MIRLLRWLPIGLLLAILAGFLISSGADDLLAQDDPAAEPAPGKKAAAEAPADSPPDAGKKGSDKKDAGAAKKPGAVPPPDPVVDALLATNPTTPAELFHAINLLVDLRRNAEARPLVKKFMDAAPDAETSAAIARKYGTGTLLKLSGTKELGPDGKKMADMILAAAVKHARDADRMAAAIKQLSDPAPEARRAAVVDLSEGGTDAVVLMIAALADAGRKEEHAAARDALVDLGAIAVAPLVGALDAPDDGVQVQAIECLGRIDDVDAAAFLIAPYLAPDSKPAVRQSAGLALGRMLKETPGPRSGERLLRRAAQARLDRKIRMASDPRGGVTLWHWNAAKKTVAPQAYHHDDALAVVAARLARDLYRVRPDGDGHRRLYLTSQLQAAKLMGGLDVPLAFGKGGIADEAARLGADAVDEVLADALHNGYVAAGIGAAEVLANVAQPSILQRPHGKNAPLVDATRHPDRRLRMAALAAIVKLRPGTPYAGSSQVAEALAYFAGSAGQPRVLIVNPRAQRSQMLAGFFGEMEVEADAATTGREAQRFLTASADYEFALIDAATDRPIAGALLQQLRADARTATLPIGLMASDAQFDTARRIATHDPLTIVVPEPQDAATLSRAGERLTALWGRHAVTPGVRRQQAERSLTWIAEITAQPQSLYDFRRHEAAIHRALDVHGLCPLAAAVLGNLGGHNAQRALVDVASQSARPLAERQAAAAAVAHCISRYGIQLTTVEIARQYERYNDSRAQDADTQKVLAAILDALEARTRKK